MDIYSGNYINITTPREMQTKVGLQKGTRCHWTHLLSFSKAKLTYAWYLYSFSRIFFGRLECVGHACRPFCIFERCLDSNPESCHRKQARYQISHPYIKLYSLWLEPCLRIKEVVAAVSVSPRRLLLVQILLFKKPTANRKWNILL